MKKFASKVGSVLTALIMIFAVVVTIMTITSVHNDDRLPNLFGYALMNVETDSMEAEGGFYVGDMIIVRLLDEEEANNLKVGDVITFRRYIGSDMYLETHRIVANTPEVNSGFYDIESEVQDGVWVHGTRHYYMTRGDNTIGIDKMADTGEFEYSSADNIIGIWEGKRIPKLGAIMKFLRSQLGFMICIVIPVALFFMYELYVFIMTLTRRQKEKTLAEVADKEAELKAKAVAEFLAQQQAAAQSAGNAPPEGDAAPAENAAPAPQAEAAPADVKNEESPAETVAEPTETPAAEPEKPAEPAAESASEPAQPTLSEEEKQRIIQEYLAKQQNGEQ